MTKWILIFLLPIVANATANPTLFDAIKVTGNSTFSAMTVGSVLFAGTAGLLSKDTSNFFWDATNHRLGLGTNAPVGMLDITNISDTLAGNISFWGQGRAPNSEWVINDSTAGALALYNINQANYGWSCSFTGHCAFGGDNTGNAATLGIRNNAGDLSADALRIDDLGSQTGRAFSVYSSGAAELAFITIGGAASFAGITNSSVGAGVVRTNSSGAQSSAEISGDGATSGSNALTLATVNGNVGSFTNGSFTVNAKGLITAAANGTAPVTSLTVATANGLAGSFSASTTPVLTLSTTVTGNVCANATAFSACTTTGSGSTVLATSPTIVTPSIAKLANLTSNGIVTTSGGDGTLSVTATTGSGSVVLASAPTLTNPVVGTQSALDNSTKAASTAYVDAALIAGGPATQALSTCTTARTIDWSTGNVFTLTLTSGNACTLTFSNPSAKSIVIWLTNGSAGGTATVVWPTAKWFPAGAPVMTTGTAALDVCTCTYNGTSYACNCLQNGG